MIHQRFEVKQHDGSQNYEYPIWDNERNDWAEGTSPTRYENEAYDAVFAKNAAHGLLKNLM